MRQLGFKKTHDRGREHLADEEHDQPDRTLFHEVENRRVHVGLLQCLDAAELLHVLGGLLFLHVEHVIHGDDAEQLLLAVHDREGVAVVFAENFERRALGVGGAQGDETAVAKLGDARGHGPDEHFADADVVDQPPALIGHVDHVERLHFAAVDADVVEGLLDRPLLANADESRGHQATDAALGVVEQRLRDGFFLGRKELDELDHGRPRQLLEQRRAVVGRHVIEDAGGLGLPHRFQDDLLRVGVEILEDIRGLRVREQAEDDGLLIVRQLGDALGDVRRRPVGKRRP